MINNILSIFSMIISLSTLILSLVKYNKHENRLNKQQNEINSYQLRKIQEEEASAKKAHIKGSIIRKTKSSVALKIFNSGEANANNVRVEIISSVKGLVFEEIMPIEIELINPHRNFDVHILLIDGHDNSIKLRYIWDDNYAQGNMNVEHLQIP